MKSRPHPNERTTHFRFILVKADLNDEGIVCTGVIFPKETQQIQLEKTETSFNLSLSLEVEPGSGVQVEKVAAFFPIQSPTDHDYLFFKNNGEAWTAATTVNAAAEALPTAYRFSVRVQYTVPTTEGKRELRYENVDPMVVVGEVDKGGGGDDSSAPRSLFAYLR